MESEVAIPPINVEKKRRFVTIRIDDTLLRRVDEYALKMRISRGKCIRDMIEEGLRLQGAK